MSLRLKSIQLLLLKGKMFLVVFVTLMISIIGLYAQVLSLQTAKINAAQSAITQTMITWNSAASAYVQSLYTSAASGGLNDPPTVTTGCQITSAKVTDNTNVCYGINSGHQLVLTRAVSPANMSFLAPGYLATPKPYIFMTTVFTLTGNIYVVTYVKYLDNNGYLLLPDANGVEVGFTLNDVIREFTNISTTDLAYGVVSTDPVTGNQMLTIGGAGNGSSVAGFVFEPIPNTIPSGAIAIISAVT